MKNLYKKPEIEAIGLDAEEMLNTFRISHQVKHTVTIADEVNNHFFGNVGTENTISFGGSTEATNDGDESKEAIFDFSWE